MAYPANPIPSLKNKKDPQPPGKIDLIIDLKIKKTFYLKILQIKIVSFFSKKTAEGMLENFDINKFVRIVRSNRKSN